MRVSVVNIKPELLPYVVEREVDVFHLAGTISVALTPGHHSATAKYHFL
jgi:hypothetical protein